MFQPPAVEQEEIEILSSEQITEVLAKLESHTLLFPIVSLALATGLRRGELLALPVGRHFFGRGDAARRAECRGDESRVAAQAAKDSGRRNLKLPAEAVAMLGATS